MMPASDEPDAAALVADALLGAPPASTIRCGRGSSSIIVNEAAN
jgi:hypothetical protein